MKQLINIARGVACGENDVFAWKFAAIGSGDTCYRTICQEELIDLCAEVNFATGCDDGLAHGHDDLRQEVGADVRMCIDQDAFGRAV